MHRNKHTFLYRIVSLLCIGATVVKLRHADKLVFGQGIGRNEYGFGLSGTPVVERFIVEARLLIFGGALVRNVAIDYAVLRYEYVPVIVRV